MSHFCCSTPSPPLLGGSRLSSEAILILSLPLLGSARLSHDSHPTSPPSAIEVRNYLSSDNACIKAKRIVFISLLHNSMKKIVQRSIKTQIKGKDSLFRKLLYQSHLSVIFNWRHGILQNS